MPADALLALDGVTAGYGGSVVIEDIALAIPPGGSLAVLGRNGAGKTTLVATIMGCTRLRRGTISWRDREIGALPSFQRARAGLGWVPQERDIFPSLTVEENLLASARPGRWDLGAVYALFPRLAERRRNGGSQLSGGEQQMLAIARALMTNPALLLLDEPLEGLAPVIVEELVAAIERMRASERTAILLVEQNAELALELTETAIVLDRGRIVCTLPSAALAADAARLESLLGVQATGVPEAS
jgi:branched-chain amino acid transport system ATP-binding protein